MAAPLCRHGCITTSFIYKIPLLMGNQLGRFYVKALKRQPIRILTIKERSELAKRPEKPSPNAELPQMRRLKPVSTTVSAINGSKANAFYPKEVEKEMQEDERRAQQKAEVTKEEDKFNRSPKVKARQMKKPNKKDSEKLVFGEDVNYERLEAGDQRFGPVVMEAKLTKSASNRSTILLEGKRLVAEGIAAALSVKSIYFTHVEILAGLPLDSLVAKGTQLYRVSEKHMKVWSDTVAPSGIMAICSMPQIIDSNDESRLPVLVICDHIQDAGHMGTTLRSAAAAGCNKILVTRGCMDAWEPKVLRAGMGAHFHIPVISTEWELVPNYLSPHAGLFLIGNNKSTAEDRPKIPRSVLQEALVTNEDSESRTKMKRKTLKLFERLRLSTRSYETVDYTSAGEVTLVIGSEDGPSPEAKRLAYSCGGEILFVPGAYELNQAVVSSVVLFEVRRQLRNKL